MAIQNYERDAALAELQEQGLTVRLRSAEKNTWHIAAGGLYSGSVVSGDELIKLTKGEQAKHSWNKKSRVDRKTRPCLSVQLCTAYSGLKDETLNLLERECFLEDQNEVN